MIEEMIELSGDVFGRARSEEEEEEEEESERESILAVIKRIISGASEDDCLEIHIDIHEGSGHVSVTQDFCDLLVNESAEEEEESEEEDEDEDEESDSDFGDE